MPTFISRAGAKLEHALATFAIDVGGLVCADLGSNTGGFVKAAPRFAFRNHHENSPWSRIEARVPLARKVCPNSPTDSNRA